MSLKLAIYNRYWNTLGGGEKYLGELAVGLSKYFDVSLISTDDSFALEKLQQRLGVNIDNLKLVTLHNADEMTISYLSKSYDVFVNGTYNSRVLNRSEKGVSVVFFPMRVPYQNELNKAGFYRLGKHVPDVGYCGRWIEGDVTYVIKGLSQKVSAVSFKILKGIPKIKQITVNDINAKFLFEKGYISVPININGPQDIDIRLSFDNEFSGMFEDGLFESTKQGIGDKLIDYDPWGHHASYQLVLADSLFAKEFITMWWKRDKGVEILYPPVDLYKSAKKDKVILAVGRFFRGGHNKKQEYLIEAFKKFMQASSGWSLHLVGGVSESPEHLEYVEWLKEKAQGQPVHFHVNASRAALIDLYGKATILWHGTGYMENEALEPEKMEHFGITPVEAMSARCIPVVYNGGGPKEYIKHGENGYLWNNLEELANYSLSIANNSSHAEEISVKAKKSYEQFSMDSFYERTQQIAEKILGGGVR